MNEQKLKTVFAESLGIPEETVVDALAYATIPQWDSIAHMALIAAIEDRFQVMIETEDVIDMSNFAKAKEIVAKYL
jgi:acyl carrier protein